RAETLAEVREPKDDGCGQQGCAAAYPALQQILHPGAEEEFFRHCCKEKCQYPPQDCAADSGQVAMRMYEAQRQSEHDDDGRVENELAQTGFPVAPLQTKIESCAAESAD